MFSAMPVTYYKPFRIILHLCPCHVNSKRPDTKPQLASIRFFNSFDKILQVHNQANGTLALLFDTPYPIKSIFAQMGTIGTRT